MKPRVDALTGLRGVAILVVVLYHAAILGQGWIGVDLFFVLSGFLITTILMKERDEPHFWKLFYIRRATRILPPLALLLTVVGLLGLVPRGLWLYLVLSGANIAMVRNLDKVPRALSVLWSLSVEEHFYLVWPLAVRRFSRSTLIKILVFVVIAEPIVRTAAYVAGASWHTTYYLTPFRLDGLAIGSLLALTIHKISFAQSRIAAICAVCCISLSWHWLVAGEYALFADSASFSIIAISSCSVLAYIIKGENGWLARLLSTKPLRFLGGISYGLYLIHTFLYVAAASAFNRMGLDHYRISSLTALPLAIVLAWLSRKYYEEPILALGKRLTAPLREEQIVVSATR